MVLQNPLIFLLNDHLHMEYFCSVQRSGCYRARRYGCHESYCSLAGSLITLPDLLLFMMRSGGHDGVGGKDFFLAGGGEDGGSTGGDLVGGKGTGLSPNPQRVSRKAGLRRSTETVSRLPPRSKVKNLAARSRTLKGPSYVHCRGVRWASWRTKTNLQSCNSTGIYEGEDCGR
jgi:hypothetical protein